MALMLISVYALVALGMWRIGLSARYQAPQPRVYVSKAAPAPRVQRRRSTAPRGRSAGQVGNHPSVKSASSRAITIEMPLPRREPGPFETDLDLPRCHHLPLAFDTGLSSLNPYTGLDDDPFGDPEIERLLERYLPQQRSRFHDAAPHRKESRP